jgi:hypothetical protein
MGGKKEVREVERAAGGDARVKTWTGLGTVLMAGAALSLGAQGAGAGTLDKAPGSGLDRS